MKSKRLAKMRNNVRDAISEWLLTAEDRGWPVPQPKFMPQLRESDGKQLP